MRTWQATTPIYFRALDLLLRIKRSKYVVKLKAVLAVQFDPMHYNHDKKLSVYLQHLCKEYITNLQSSSAIIRRASASILVSICQHSKKPQFFLPKLLHQVTGLLKPKLMENSVSAIIGSMQCIRHIISPLYNLISNSRSFPKSEVPNVVLQLVQVRPKVLLSLHIVVIVTTRVCSL